jgi:succinate dehydrogenase / fumarate reductase cytochrome b subunit
MAPSYQWDMPDVLRLWSSTVGTKALAAVSGLLLWAWVVLHVLGNLTVFSGAGAIDAYAAALRHAPLPLWAARGGLALVAVVHVAAVASLARAGRRARPRHDVRAAPRSSTIAARTMRLGGLLLVLFLGYHLLHLTAGVLHPRFVPGRVYDNVVLGLRPAWVAAIYVGAALLVGLHLVHGLWSAVRSLGLRPDVAARARRPAVAVLAAAIAVGFASVPIAVLTGYLR